MEEFEFDDNLSKESLTNTQVDSELIKSAISSLLSALGENLEREGLKRTPERVAGMYSELLIGYQADPKKIVNDALFEVKYDEMVIVRDIEFYSLCEHHLLPFMGRVHVAYIPNGKVIGLSKVPRIVDMFARRLQVQERLTRQIADLIRDTLDPHGVAVVVEGLHLCMGEAKPGDILRKGFKCESCRFFNKCPDLIGSFVVIDTILDIICFCCLSSICEQSNAYQDFLRLLPLPIKNTYHSLSHKIFNKNFIHWVFLLN